MSAFLLDVNVLVALMWPADKLHSRAHRWFATHSKQGWATCPLTQAGFVRITSNPAFSPDALIPQEALDLLGANLAMRSHSFWFDDIGLADALEGLSIRLSGHQQITDAYLLGLTSHHDGKLATMDRSLVALLSQESPHLTLIEFIQ